MAQINRLQKLIDRLEKKVGASAFFFSPHFSGDCDSCHHPRKHPWLPGTESSQDPGGAGNGCLGVIWGFVKANADAAVRLPFPPHLCYLEIGCGGDRELSLLHHLPQTVGLGRPCVAQMQMAPVRGPG